MADAAFRGISMGWNRVKNLDDRRDNSIFFINIDYTAGGREIFEQVSCSSFLSLCFYLETNCASAAHIFVPA